MQASTLFCKKFWWTVGQLSDTNFPHKNGTTGNKRFGYMVAGRCYFGILSLSAVVSADVILLGFVG
jgi:hypothetical protein